MLVNHIFLNHFYHIVVFYQQIREFTTRHQNIFTAGELAAVAAIEENISAAVTWSSQNAALVEAWLRENYGRVEDEDSASTMLTASLLIVVSVITALFNH